MKHLQNLTNGLIKEKKSDFRLLPVYAQPCRDSRPSMVWNGFATHGGVIGSNGLSLH